MFAQRLKQLRAERGITQIQLAEMLEVSKGTVAMWETDQRKPSWEILFQLSDIFDRRIDYILGHTDDVSSPKPTEEDIDQLGRWAAEESFYEDIMKYLRLDEYGKAAVEAIISSEFTRCHEQNTLFSAEDYKLSIQIAQK